MSPWKSFYEGREGNDYLQYVKKRYAPYIDAIQSRIELFDLVLELGTGTGTITHALCDDKDWSQHRPRIAASDIDDDMITIARNRLNGCDVAVFKLDAKATIGPRADVVHSHGMLEHFDDDTINLIISNYRSARVQVHYVTGLYDAPTFGDERLMSVDDWWRICKPSQIITFNEGLDYALIFE